MLVMKQVTNCAIHHIISAFIRIKNESKSSLVMTCFYFCVVKFETFVKPLYNNMLIVNYAQKITIFVEFFKDFKGELDVFHKLIHGRRRDKR